MKSSLKFLTVGAVAFAIGLSANNFAISGVGEYKVAVVDIQKVVASSNQVKSLKAEQKKKVEDLTKFVKNAKVDLNTQKDTDKKKALEEKYNKELNTKKENIEKDYAKRLGDIDKNITATIQSKAKADKYDLVVAKGVVLFGGEDITNEIAKAVK